MTSNELYKLLNKTCSATGNHWIVSVSHGKEHNGGSGRIHDTYLIDQKYKDEFKVYDHRIGEFDCDGKPAIAFIVML